MAGNLWVNGSRSWLVPLGSWRVKTRRFSRFRPCLNMLRPLILGHGWFGRSFRWQNLKEESAAVVVVVFLVFLLVNRCCRSSAVLDRAVNLPTNSSEDPQGRGITFGSLSKVRRSPNK